MQQSFTALALGQDILIDTTKINSIKDKLEVSSVKQQILNVETNIVDSGESVKKITRIDKKFEVDKSNLIIYLCLVYIFFLTLIYLASIRNDK